MLRNAAWIRWGCYMVCLGPLVIGDSVVHEGLNSGTDMGGMGEGLRGIARAFWNVVIRRWLSPRQREQQQNALSFLFSICDQTVLQYVLERFLI